MHILILWLNVNIQKVNKKKYRNKFLTRDALREITFYENLAYSRAKREGKKIEGFTHPTFEGYDGSYNSTGLGMYAIPIVIPKKLDGR